MKVLVTGVNGQLGFDVCKELDRRNIENKGIEKAVILQMKMQCQLILKIMHLM